MLDQPTALFLLAEVRRRNEKKMKKKILWFCFKVFLVIYYRPVIEELADIILSADIETVEAVQRHFGEEVIV